MSARLGVGNAIHELAQLLDVGVEKVVVVVADDEVDHGPFRVAGRSRPGMQKAFAALGCLG